MRHQPARSLVTEYRNNLDSYTAWEDKERKRQEEAIAAFRRRERERTGYFRVPRWVAIVAAILTGAVIGWLFVALAFSFKG